MRRLQNKLLNWHTKYEDFLNEMTVNYDTGEVCFGPVNVIGAGNNVAPAAAVSISDSASGLGSIVDPLQLPSNLQIPVVFIPANNSTIPATTPGTIINIVTPSITVQPIGSIVPPTIPLNSLTPTDFNQTPVVLDIPDLTNLGSLSDSTCF